MDKTSYRLRLATMDDYNFVYDVKKATLKEHIEKVWGWDEEYQKKDFKEYYNPVNTNIIMCNSCDIGILETKEDDTELHVIELEILPSYQGMGIGTDILKEIIKNSQFRGKKVKVGCFKINEEAKKLYIRLGFKKIEETETHYLLEK